MARLNADDIEAVFDAAMQGAAAHPALAEDYYEWAVDSTATGGPRPDYLSEQALAERARCEISLDAEFERNCPDGLQPGDAVLWALRVDRLIDCIVAAPITDRQAACLCRHYEHWSNRKVAEDLGISEATVRRELRIALAIIAGLLPKDPYWCLPEVMAEAFRRYALMLAGR